MLCTLHPPMLSLVNNNNTFGDDKHDFDWINNLKIFLMNYLVIQAQMLLCSLNNRIKYLKF